MRTPRLPNTYRDISLPQWCAQIWKATRFEFTINLKTSRGRLRTRGNRETSIAEALDELESKVGKDGRRKFEKFLRSMGEELDDEDDVIDVESA